MSTRKIIDPKQNGEKVWLKGHAQAIYMSDGSTVEDAINSIEIPSLDDYVTETELNDKGFLTEHQDISHLASRNWVESQGYAHQEDLLEISFNDIQDSPISIDDSGMINFVDESGNVGFQINEEGLRVTDVIAGEHKLSEKANASDIPSLDGYVKAEDIPSLDGLVKSEDLPNFDEFAKTSEIPSLDGYATEEYVAEKIAEAELGGEDIDLSAYATKEWVNNRNYATEYDLKTIDYSSINNVPVSEDETGELNIADESGNIGMKVASEAVYAKDFVAGEHKLSEKVDRDEVSQKQDVISDLETIRQGAAKGATALQSYTEQYTGTVTGVKINGTTKSQSNGIVDLGTVITAHQTLKTINGQSIVGSGDITISGGSSGGMSGGSGAYTEVNHGTSDTTFTLTPNSFHIWDEVSALTLTLGSETAGIANEFLFQFTSGSTATTLSLPSDIKWAEEFTIEQNKIYQISILNGLGSVLSWELNTTLKFTVNQNNTLYEYEYMPGMCWDEWIASKYNIDNYIISGTHVRKDSRYGLYESDNYIKINSTDEIIENCQYRLLYDD